MKIWSKRIVLENSLLMRRNRERKYKKRFKNSKFNCLEEMIMSNNSMDSFKCSYFSMMGSKIKIKI